MRPCQRRAMARGSERGGGGPASHSASVCDPGRGPAASGQGERRWRVRVRVSRAKDAGGVECESAEKMGENDRARECHS